MMKIDNGSLFYLVHNEYHLNMSCSLSVSGHSTQACSVGPTERSQFTG